jgi:hypothetical protein
MQLSQENEFTTSSNPIDVEQLKADIVEELVELLPDLILDKFDERMASMFGIKAPTRH